jgi:hypothetical protein
VRNASALLLPLAVVVCSCSSTDQGTIQIVTGGETDTFSQSPQPTTLTVYAIDSTGARSTLASAPLPTSSIDLGNQDESGGATLQVIAADLNSKELVYGQSLALQYGALNGSTLPIFVQRANQFARLPSPLTDVRQAPTLAVISGEFVFVGGGSDPTTAETTQLYDFAQYAPMSSPPSLPRVPLSMPVIGTFALLIDQNGGTYYDFSQNNSPQDAPVPSGFSFADVAGGQVFYAVDQTSGNLDYVFVVGATRTTGAATAAVLQINPNDTSNSGDVMGNLTWLTLSEPRLGAAATWVKESSELVVTGGSASAAGVELVTPGQKTPSPIASFPPDASIGAGAAEIDSSHVLVAGGLTPGGKDAGVREIDIVAHTAQVWGSGLGVPLTSASTFAFASNANEPALVVGNERASGLTHAFLLNSMKATEVLTKVPHIGARAIGSPNGSVVLFGGRGEIESFFPTTTQ